MISLRIMLTILLCTIIAFLSGKTPFSIIPAGIILALILTGITKLAEALSGLINTNVTMFVVMSVIDAAPTKTSLLGKTQKLMVRYKNNPKMLILISSLVANFLACLISVTATAAIMTPLLVGITNEIGTNHSKILLPAAAIVNIATAMTFLGQGASDMTWSDVMIKVNASTPFSIWDLIIARIPILLISLACVVFIGYRLMLDADSSQFSDNVQEKDTVSHLAPSKEKVIVILILGTIACILLEPVTGIKMYPTASIGACLLVLCGMLSKREALGSTHQPTVFLFTGILALPDAIKVAGAGDMVADWTISPLGNAINSYVIMVIFFIIPLVLAQMISNLTTMTILVPLVAAACVKIGMDPGAAVMGVLIAGCIPILTPMTTPCQTMIMGPGRYSLKNYLKCRAPLAVMITIVCIFTLPIIFPSY